MIDRLLKVFGVEKELVSEERDQLRLQSATAVLLVEIARADHERAGVEHEAMREALEKIFSLSSAAAEKLLSRAEVAAENSTSLHEFTRVLHKEMERPEKHHVIEMLWRIAFADSTLDKYEDYMIGKIAELLYVARGDVIRLRQKVIDSMP